MLLFGPPISPGEPSAVLITIDSDQDEVAWKFVAKEAKAIDTIVVRNGTVTGTSPTYEVRLETVDGVGDPTGTLVTANANGTFTPSSSNETNEVALTASWTPSINDIFFVRLKYSSGTIDGSNNVQFQYRGSTTAGPGSGEHPFTSTDAGTNWTAYTAQYNIVGVKYSDGTYLESGIASAAAGVTANQDYDDGTNPDERGMGWVQPFTIDTVGAYVMARFFSGGTGDARLYEGTTQLESVSLTEAWLSSTSVNDMIYVRWSTSQTLTKDSTYYLAIRATHATNNIRYPIWLAHEEEARKAVFGVFFAANRDGGGAWTQDLNSCPCGYMLDIDQDSVSEGGASEEVISQIRMMQP